MQNIKTSYIPKIILNTFMGKKLNKWKKILDILKNLWLDKMWNKKNDLSINHDSVLYK